MQRHARPHPLQSTRFWLVILAAVGGTAAWKLNLLPVTPHHDHEAAAVPDVELGTGVSADRIPDATFSEGFLGQSEPASDDPAMSGTTGGPPEHSADPAELPRVMPQITRTEENPFGPARPVFERVQESADPAFPAAAEVGTGINSNAGLAGSIVLTADHEQVAPEPGTSPAGRVETTSVATDVSIAGPASPIDFAAIDALLETGTPDADIEALRALSKLYWEHTDARPELKDRLNATARRIYFQPQPHYMDAHEVQPGETLEAIARQYSVSWEYLARLNRADGGRIRAGQELKVIKGPFTAIVDLSDYDLTVHCHGYYVYKFPVGIGKDGATPLGTFQVQDKVVNPPYHGPEGAIAADDPANPIGERWISLGDGYGIHGTIEPDSIGKGESRGCVRMHNKDVEIVYDLLTVGSEVVIQR
jgi:lipoprotein-anchoring transpeptidase ErfK/SrfK